MRKDEFCTVKTTIDMHCSLENKETRSTGGILQCLCNACVSAQLLSIGILFNFFVLAATFVDWETLFINQSPIITIYNFSGIIFISALLSSLIWILQALRGKTRIEYFKRHRFFVIMEQATFVAWLISGIFFSVFDISLPEGMAGCLFTATCGLGMLVYFLSIMFAYRTSEKPQKVGSKKADSVITAITMASIIDELA